jgi:hypothetical protein
MGVRDLPVLKSRHALNVCVLLGTDNGAPTPHFGSESESNSRTCEAVENAISH